MIMRCLKQTWTEIIMRGSSCGNGGVGDEVVIIDPSPTNFNPDCMPKKIASNVYTCASKRAYPNWVRIHRLLGNCDKKVKELEEIQEERTDGESSEDEYSEKLRKERVCLDQGNNFNKLLRKIS